MKNILSLLLFTFSVFGYLGPGNGGGGGGGTPGGSSGEAQYNNSGAFGGFGSWDGTTFSVSNFISSENSNFGSTNSPTRTVSVDSGTNAYLSFNSSGTEISVIGSEPGSRNFLIYDTSLGEYVISEDSSGAINFNQAYTFPTTDGTSGQVISTDGAGTLGWTTPSSAAGGLDTQLQFNSSGTLSGFGEWTGTDVGFGGSAWAIGMYLSPAGLTSGGEYASWTATSADSILIKARNSGSSSSMNVAGGNATGDSQTGGNVTLTAGTGQDSGATISYGGYAVGVGGSSSGDGGEFSIGGGTSSGGGLGAVITASGGVGAAKGNVTIDSTYNYILGYSTFGSSSNAGRIITIDPAGSGPDPYLGFAQSGSESLAIGSLAGSKPFVVYDYVLDEYIIDSNTLGVVNFKYGITTTGDISASSNTISASQLTSTSAIDVPHFYSSGSGIAFFGVTQVNQANTGITPATFTANTSGIADDSATWDGYTMGQVVAALRAYGLLQ